MKQDPIDLIRTALAFKVANVKHASQAYIRDQASRSKSTISSYIVGACFLLGSAIFAIVAILVGAAALFRFMEMRYGLFEAFGATGGTLVVVALISLAVGLSKMRSKSARIVPLASRVRVAAHSNPITKENVKDAAVSLIEPPHRQMTLGIAAAGALLSYVLLRRRHF